MNNPGYVYILINPSIQGLIKVGKTTKDPNERAEELSRATGVPTPFIVGYQIAVNNCTKAEKFVHTWLEHKGYRVSDNREFFNAPMTDAINAMMEYKETLDNEFCDDEIIIASKNNISNHMKPWIDIEDMANNYWLGRDDYLQDYKEAFIRFKQAIKLGSPTAYRSIGIMYMLGQGCTKDYDIALECFKKCIRENDFQCYAYMMRVYASLNHDDNVLKCWDFYVRKVEQIEPQVGFDYISYAYYHDLQIIHLDKMLIFREEIKEIMLNAVSEAVSKARIVKDNGKVLLVGKEVSVGYVMNYVLYLFDLKPNEKILTAEEYKKKELIC